MSDRKKLLEKIDQLSKEVEEYKSKFLRALADYQNYERRVHKEKESFVQEAHARIMLKLLPFLDNLEKAELFVKDPGIKLIKDDFCATLTSLGLKEIDVLGKEFDPVSAEAVDVAHGENDNRVIEVIRKGYRYGDRLLRPAQVKVEKKPQTL